MNVSRLISSPLFIRAVIVLALWSVFAAINQGWAGSDGIYALLDGAALTALLAIGLGVTMLAGELDLSIGSIAAVSGILAVKLTGSDPGPAIALVAGGALALGALQGLLIATIRISSLVFTLGTLIVLQGAAFLLVGGQSSLSTALLTDLTASDTLAQRFGVASPSSIVVVLVACGVAAWLAFTRHGHELRAVGGGRSASAGAGVSHIRPLVTAFAISGFCAGLAGAMAGVKAGSAGATDYATTTLILVVTAVLVGGVSLYGGRGSIVGILLGVMTLQILHAGLAARGVAAPTLDLVTGCVLLVAMVGEFFFESPFMQRRRQRRIARGDTVPA